MSSNIDTVGWIIIGVIALLILAFIAFTKQHGKPPDDRWDDPNVG